MTLHRAYSILEVRQVDHERRSISGLASTPTVDRMGDVIEPEGVQFAAEIPLLLHHDHTKPVGRVRLGKATKAGVPFTAELPQIDEPGIVQDRVNEAWVSVKHRLIAGVSIGFRTLNDAVERMKGGGLRFLETEVLELSLVVIPANAEASITSIKSIDRDLLKAASGTNEKPAKRAYGVKLITRKR